MPNYQWYVNSKRQKLIEELKKIPDRKDLSVIIEEALETYLKIHGSGNPAYTLDQFRDPDFKAYPAFMSSLENWISYISKCNENEIKEIRGKAVSIKMAIDRRYS